MDSFSTRHGLGRPDADISIRLEAPEELRDAVVAIGYQCGIKPSELREFLCRMLYRAPDRSNWSDYPNIDGEVRDLIRDCEWFEVYDLVELLAERYERRGTDFAGEINRMFRIKGVGWQLVGTRLEMRGSEAFELAVREGQADLLRRGNTIAANELHESISDLSRRPVPEVSDAIQHAMAALECVARDVCGTKDTLGDVIRRNPKLFPRPVDQIVEKAWGYTSNLWTTFDRGAAAGLRRGGTDSRAEWCAVALLEPPLSSLLRGRFWQLALATRCDLEPSRGSSQVRCLRWRARHRPAPPTHHNSQIERKPVGYLTRATSSTRWTTDIRYPSTARFN